MKNYMVIDNGDVVSPSKRVGLFETYMAAKSFADSHNTETSEYHAKFGLKSAYVIAVDADKPYSSIGSY